MDKMRPGSSGSESNDNLNFKSEGRSGSDTSQSRLEDSLDSSVSRPVSRSVSRLDISPPREPELPQNPQQPRTANPAPRLGRRLGEALEAGKANEYLQKQAEEREETLNNPGSEKFWRDTNGDNGLTRLIRASSDQPERVGQTLDMIRRATPTQLRQPVGLTTPEHLQEHKKAIQRMHDANKEYRTATSALDAGDESSPQYSQLRDAVNQAEDRYHAALVESSANPPPNVTALQIALATGNPVITSAIIAKLREAPVKSGVPSSAFSTEELVSALAYNRSKEVGDILRTMPEGTMDSLTGLPPLSLDTIKTILESEHAMSEDTVAEVVKSYSRRATEFAQYRELTGIVQPNYHISQGRGDLAVKQLIEGVKTVRAFGGIRNRKETTEATHARIEAYLGYLDAVRDSIERAAKLKPVPSRLQELRKLVESPL